MARGATLSMICGNKVRMQEWSLLNSCTVMLFVSAKMSSIDHGICWNGGGAAEGSSISIVTGGKANLHLFG